MTEEQITLVIPEPLWKVARKDFRKLRRKLQRSGGTSVLRKNGQTILFSAKGDYVAVSIAMSDVRDIKCKMKSESREWLRDKFSRFRENLESGQLRKDIESGKIKFSD